MKNYRLHATAAAGVLAGFVIVSALQTRGQGQSPAMLPPPSAGLVALHLKFNGAASCASEQCHGAAKEKPNGDSFSNEYTLWSSQGMQADPHHNKTWQDLRDPKGRQIAQGLGIADATKSDRCLGCHALNVPDALHGKNYKLNEGVTCEACHGPSEKWLDPHSKKGWYGQVRAQNDFRKLLEITGLYDTRPVHARAQRCTSCHLAIEPDLVEKGHPQPAFELNYYSETYANRHWHDPGGYYKVSLWAGGQQVALDEALRQLAGRASATGKPLEQAYQQAMAHWAMLNQILSVALPGKGAALSGAMQKLDAAYAGKSGLAAAATAAADADAKLADDVENLRPDKATALKLLNAIAAQNDLATHYGKSGQDQQSYAIYALYSGYADASKINPDTDPVMDFMGKNIFSDPPPAPAQYLKSLAELRGKLPKP